MDCPNCHITLKDGMLSSVKLLEAEKVRLINEYSITKAEGYCSKCGKDLYLSSQEKYNSEVASLQNSIGSIIHVVPVISIHSPLNWDYNVLGLVTGQSVTGTGVISEFTSSWTDLFGKQAGRYNQKLKAGEVLCASQLRKQTLDLGGNAIVAVDIDYSEVGGDKGMLMVCMTGTAVHLKNPEVLGEKRVERITKLIDLNRRAVYLSALHVD